MATMIIRFLSSLYRHRKKTVRSHAPETMPDLHEVGAKKYIINASEPSIYCHLGKISLVVCGMHPKHAIEVLKDVHAKELAVNQNPGVSTGVISINSLSGSPTDVENVLKALYDDGWEWVECGDLATYGVVCVPDDDRAKYA